MPLEGYFANTTEAAFGAGSVWVSSTDYGPGPVEGRQPWDAVYRIDPETNRVAKAEPGLRLGEFIVEAEKYGLVSPTGTVSDTGLAGLTLGGYGYLSGKYGLALDNLLSAEVVTADGLVLRTSAEEHSDLYWALRGGSGNVGVVTSFELRLHPVAQVLGGMVIHPFERADEVLRFYREVAASAPDELTVYAALATMPDGQQAVAIMPCYCGPDLAEGERILAPIRAFEGPIADPIHPMKYSEMNTLVDAANPSGMRNYWKSNLMRELGDGAIDVIVEHVARVPSPRTVVLIDQLHGVASRVPASEAAFAHRDTRHNVMVMSMWEEPADDEANIAWTRGLSTAIEPFATGAVYVNGAYEQRPSAAYGTNYDRLVEIKTAYDPTNFFRHNQNTRPREGGDTEDAIDQDRRA